MQNERPKTLILSGDDVNLIVDKYGLDKLMDLLLHRLDDAIKTFDQRATEIPIRSGFNYTGQHPGLVEWMPLHKKGEEVTIKVVGYHPRNPETYHLPTILSTISSYETRTGHLKGIVDGVLLTALRTGAASAIASKYLADPDSTVLGLIGCGAQSITQLHALSRIFDIQNVLIYDVDESAMATFDQRCEMLHIKAETTRANIEKIMGHCDIVCTATSIKVGEGPLFNAIAVKENIHINAVGSDFPGKVELPLSLLRKAKVIPDFTGQAIIEGECQQLDESDIGPDLTTLVQQYGEYGHFRNSTTVFDSTGWALEDQVVMDLFLELAQEFDIGLELAIENTSVDAKNPYHYFLKSIEV